MDIDDPLRTCEIKRPELSVDGTCLSGGCEHPTVVGALHVVDRRIEIIESLTNLVKLENVYAKYGVDCR
jgi:hypothetical protein